MELSWRRPVDGGKVYGTWPGLDEEELHEGRDLAVTTDFRSVIASVTEKHMKLVDSQIHTLFPARPNKTPINLIHA